MRRLLVLLLIFALLAPALPVKAQGSYYALSFDGEDDEVIITDSDSLHLQTFTIVALLKSEYKEEEQNIVFKDGQYRVFYRTDDEYGKRIWVDIWDDNGTRYRFQTADGEYPPLGVSSFVATSYDDSYVRVYLNTEKVLEDSLSITVQTTINALHIANGAKANFYLVLIYNRALSDTEIQQIYNDPLSPPTDGLVLWLAPDSVDTANDIWTDKSGNGNDGTIVGASYVPLRPIEESTPSQNSPYGLYFDGQDDKVVLPLEVKPNENDTDRTIVVFGYFPQQEEGIYGDHKDILRGSNNFGFSTASGFNTNGKIRMWGTFYNNGMDWVINSNINILNKVAMIAGTWDYDSSTSTSTIKLYVNGELDVSDTKTGVTFSDPNPSNPLKLATGYAGAFKGEIYLVLIYNRALSDTEIQQIYNDPTNPPTDGLVLWYDPYSYDPSTGKWLNKAPIFPTIPLVEELDGQNYEATAERVNIPRLYVYDANTSEQIPYTNVSLTLYFNNTTTGLIPSIPILPWNETVSLNVSATNYESASLSTWSGVDLISVYLEPANVTTNITKLTKLVNPTPPQELGTYAFNISDINTEFSKLFTGATGWALAVIFVMALTVASLKFHQKPAVTAAVAGASIVYLGTWINANWSILWLLMAMLMSATILRIFGRYQK